MRASIKRMQEHAERVLRKQQRLDMVRALIATHEKQPDPDVVELKRLYVEVDHIQTQLNVMSR